MNKIGILGEGTRRGNTVERAVEWDVDQGKVEVRVGDRIIEGDIDRQGILIEGIIVYRVWKWVYVEECLVDIVGGI